MVVVGHGTSPVGKRWGKVIDSYDIVMRLWNWHWQRPRDWGKRYNLGFYEISPTEMARFNRYNCRYPDQGWVGTLLKPYEGFLPNNTTLVDQDRWCQEATKMGGSGAGGKALKLTRGVQAAAWLMSTQRQPNELMLVGFDNSYKGWGLPPEQAFPKAYMSCKAMFPLRDYAGGARQYSSHDYGIEKPFLEAMAARVGTRLFWSQDCWEDPGVKSSQ
jgi:hypothetical protein